MFSRLLKYEWKATAGTLGILSAAMLGLSVMDCVILRFLLSDAGQQLSLSEVPQWLLGTALRLILIFSAIALALYFTAVVVLLLYRFYRNKFTDEGYLTFTLPVRPAQIVGASVVNMLLWMLIAAVVVVASVAIAVVLGVFGDEALRKEVLYTLREILPVLGEQLGDFSETIGSAYPVLTLLQTVLMPLYAVLVPMACITAGAAVAKKHKILAAFGIYYGVNFVVNLITSTMTMLPLLPIARYTDDSLRTAMTVTALVQLLVTAAVTAGAWFFTTGTMKRRLNLP